MAMANSRHYWYWHCWTHWWQRRCHHSFSALGRSAWGVYTQRKVKTALPVTSLRRRILSEIYRTSPTLSVKLSASSMLAPPRPGPLCTEEFEFAAPALKDTDLVARQPFHMCSCTATKVTQSVPDALFFKAGVITTTGRVQLRDKLTADLAHVCQVWFYHNPDHNKIIHHIRYISVVLGHWSFLLLCKPNYEAVG